MIIPIWERIVTLGMQKKGKLEKAVHELLTKRAHTEDNSYKRLKGELDLRFLYPETKDNNGGKGPEEYRSRGLFQTMPCRVGGKYYQPQQTYRALQYALVHSLILSVTIATGKTLPLHSTISSTRQLFPVVVLTQVFTKVFGFWVEAKMDLRPKRGQLSISL